GSSTPIALEASVKIASRIHPAESAGSLTPHAEELPSQIFMRGTVRSSDFDARHPSVFSREVAGRGKIERNDRSID
ncbi:MAG: hypothetical protein Q8P67_19170, partial [archaeon]|nr:hypothetical protein [archaeon]